MSYSQMDHILRKRESINMKKNNILYILSNRESINIKKFNIAGLSKNDKHKTDKIV